MNYLSVRRFFQTAAATCNSSLKAFMVLMLLGSYPVLAQDQTITGTVTEVNGSPLPGVTVALKGTTKGANTDATGSFRIQAPASGILVFSFVGKISQEVAIGNKTTVNVALADDSKSLQEVVVTGYGTQRRKDLTGSIASISSDEFQKGNIIAPEQLIAGKLAGVSITPPSGQPGGGSTIRIRGGSSLNASNDPLVVIDNVPVDNQGISGAANPLSLINPNDIETFTVLKDASAAAIYGARAANGVILITTKKGATGAPKITFSTQLSLSRIAKKVSVLNSDQFRSLINDVTPATGFTTPEQRSLTSGTTSTDWQDQIYQTGISNDNNLAISGAYRNIPYRVSYGYTTQNGILKTSNFQRHSVALNLSPKFLNNDLRVDISAKGSIVYNRFADQGAIGSAISFDPTKPVYSGNDNYGGFFEWLDPTTGRPNGQATRNPLGLLLEKQDRNQINRLVGNVQLDYRMPFLRELRANLNLGLDASSTDGRVLVPAYAASSFGRGQGRPGITGDYATTGGIDRIYTQTRTNKTLEFYLNYAKDLKSIRSRVDLTGGYSYQDFIRDEPSYADNIASGAQYNPAGNPFRTQYTLLAFFGRLNYTFNDKYVLTGTIRRDGTSRFSPNARWGWFPSLGASWSVKDENFLKDSKTVSALKLRLGYGVTGQQDLPAGVSNYPYLPTYLISDPTAQYQFGNTFYNTLRAGGYDANIKWEQTESINAAVDYALFDGRISGSIDFYDKKTKDLLAVIPVAAGSNLTNQILTNVGNLQNRGVEFLINTTPIQREGLKLEVGFNYTYNENKITNLTKVPTPNDPGILVGGISGGTGNTIQIQTVGYPTNTFYVNRQIYNANGQPIEGVYQDMNADGSITVNDRYRYKTANPVQLFGFTSSLAVGQFTASFVLRGTAGNYVYNNVRAGNGTTQSMVNSLGFLSNASTNVLDTRFRTQQFFSDYYVENASFLRLDNLNFGYNFGRVIGSRANLRLNATFQNLFVITKYSGLDPEISGGIDNNFYPRPRVGTLGLNLDF
ncbi:SusC/RagA family TonB-linked outer membrane protein [Fibrella forsythiae]|uniref:SusC/RagA family TonB-linked outer membrane protein n=1 Tax=Fibrella forsythiae TaxID=2817061 RepID=A0ABS3JC83_9BACT|nr:SusC/RagA family TonB-linked outer membrane protein [Fibrella forsythiae]MBO0947614.1 SusC/RagA family TonB-linked outer membrane protein [Fibrella forsythiae]